MDDGRQDHALKQCRQNIYVADQDQIVDWASIGDDQLHPSKPQTLEVLDIAAQIFDRDIRPDLVGLQEIVELETGLEA